MQLCKELSLQTIAATAQLSEAVKHLIVSINIKHGTDEAEQLSQWLQIWKSELDDMGPITLETLGQWCRATTGQAGTLVLDREDSGHRYFIYQMTHCGYCARDCPTRIQESSLKCTAQLSCKR